MKKVLTLLLVLALAVSVFAGCAGTQSKDTTVKVGVGTVTSIAKSRDYSVAADGKETLARAQVDTVIAAASFDKDGKVISVTIDTAQSRVDYDKDLKVTSDKTAEVKTKLERGADYGMKGSSEIGKEWNEQIAALEAWMVGKTVEEIKAMELNEDVPAVEELTASVTIGVTDYIAAVEEAYNTAVEAKNVTKLGLGHVVSIAKSRDYAVAADGKETTARAQVDVTIAVTGFDKDDKVVTTLIDVAQTRVEYNADGTVKSDKEAAVKTKKELGADYGMKGSSGIGKEWNEQIVELEKWMAGKSVADIKAMELNDGVPAVAELTSSVTVGVDAYIAAVEESLTNAK